jgi:hypothetical protein
MILVDLTQVLISNCVVSLAQDLKKSDDPVNLIKHTSLSTLLSYKKKYGKEYGDMLLACDGNSYWRKDYFPAYKGQRKHGRADSSLDWDIVFKAINEIKIELRENFRFKIIEHPKAEADDIIAVMTKWLQENELVTEGLFDSETQKILILSADGDFVQLQKYKNVRQWSPMQKKFVLAKMKPQEYINEHICEGDNGDNIPGVLTGDDWAKNRADNIDDKVRATPIKKARKEAFRLNGIDECKTDDERRNWQRNQKLIDFDCIPDDLSSQIINQYNKYEVQGNRTKIMNYLMKNRMKLLLESIGDF